MTTHVMIVNRGPSKHVKVEVLQRDAEGKFHGSQEHFVSPHAHVEVLVHTAQSLQVHEIEDYEAEPRATGG